MCFVKGEKTFLMHLPLTFAGVVCILSLKGRQEQCPFTTRLRGLKLIDGIPMAYQMLCNGA